LVDNLAGGRVAAYDGRVHTRFRLRHTLVCLVFIIGAGLFVLFSKPEQPLLRRAVPLECTRGVITEEKTRTGYYLYIHSAPSYFWLSPTEILQISESDPGVYETVQVDLTRGRHTRQPGRSLLGRAVDRTDDTFYWLVSPDGKWLFSMRRRGADIVYGATRFDGAAERSWTNRFGGGQDPTWLNDSSAIVEWRHREGVNYLRVYWLDGGFDELNGDSVSVEPAAGGSHPLGAWTMVPIGMWSPGEAAEYIRLVRDGTNTAAARLSIPTPPELAGVEGKTVLSPSGDRLAWLYYFKRRIPRIRLKSDYPYFDTRPLYVTTLFVSDVGRDGLRCLGSLPPDQDINEVVWTPDGKALSFVHDGALWTVAAD
jgi:hypothetical protein